MGTEMGLAYERLRSGLPPIIQGDGSQVQDLIYVADAARANILAMDSEISAESFNIVSGVDTPLNTMVNLMTRLCGSDLKPEYRDDQDKLSLRRVTRIGFTGEKAKRMLDWEAQVSLEEGLGRVVAWLDRQSGAA